MENFTILNIGGKEYKVGMTEEEVKSLDEVLKSEAQRNLNEIQRGNNEDLRISKENDRVSKESQRETNESLRILKENDRISNEKTRIANEAIRKENEKKRIEDFEKFNITSNGVNSIKLHTPKNESGTLLNISPISTVASVYTQEDKNVGTFVSENNELKNIYCKHYEPKLTKEMFMELSANGAAITLASGGEMAIQNGLPTGVAEICRKTSKAGSKTVASTIVHPSGWSLGGFSTTKSGQINNINIKIDNTGKCSLSVKYGNTSASILTEDGFVGGYRSERELDKDISIESVDRIIRIDAMWHSYSPSTKEGYTEKDFNIEDVIERKNYSIQNIPVIAESNGNGNYSIKLNKKINKISGWNFGFFTLDVYYSRG